MKQVWNPSLTQTKNAKANFNQFSHQANDFPYSYDIQQKMRTQRPQTEGFVKDGQQNRQSTSQDPHHQSTQDHFYPSSPQYDYEFINKNSLTHSEQVKQSNNNTISYDQFQQKQPSFRDQNNFLNEESREGIMNMKAHQNKSDQPYKTYSIQSSQSQPSLSSLLKFQLNELKRLFQDIEKASSLSIEHQSIKFIQDTFQQIKQYLDQAMYQTIKDFIKSNQFEEYRIEHQKQDEDILNLKKKMEILIMQGKFELQLEQDEKNKLSKSSHTSDNNQQMNINRINLEQKKELLIRDIQETKGQCLNLLQDQEEIDDIEADFDLEQFKKDFESSIFKNMKITFSFQNKIKLGEQSANNELDQKKYYQELNQNAQQHQIDDLRGKNNEKIIENNQTQQFQERERALKLQQQQQEQGFVQRGVSHSLEKEKSDQNRFIRNDQQEIQRQQIQQQPIKNQFQSDLINIQETQNSSPIQPYSNIQVKKAFQNQNTQSPQQPQQQQSLQQQQQQQQNYMQLRNQSQQKQMSPQQQQQQLQNLQGSPQYSSPQYQRRDQLQQNQNQTQQAHLPSALTQKQSSFQNMPNLGTSQDYQVQNQTVGANQAVQQQFIKKVKEFTDDQGNWYRGEVINGNIKDGKGEIRYAKDGSTYKGDFKNGQKQGRGEFITAKGEKYQGEWQNDMRHGFGKSEDAQTGMIYYGQWACDKMHGMGTLSGSNNFFYNGEFKHGKMHGKGVRKFEDKSTFEGFFEQGLRSGRGKLIQKDGSAYEGEWSNDKKNGKGIFQYIDGSILRGLWLNDKIHGRGELEKANGQKIVGEWKDNQLVKVISTEK